MATYVADGNYVIVRKGDTLSQIAVTYKKESGGATYKQLAAINNISNPNLIYDGQKIYLTKDGAGGGGTTPSSSTTTENSNKPTIKQFGEQSNAEGTLFATWDWSKDNTESYKVLWTYDTGDGVWFNGNNSTVTVDEDAPVLSRQSTYSVPGGAKRVQFKVKPISKTYKKNDKDVNYWTADWSDTKTWTNQTPLEAPGAPSVEDIVDYTLTANLKNLEITGATGIEFEIYKDNQEKPYKTGKATIVTGAASYSCTVSPGGMYKVRCRAYGGSNYSEWSEYSEPKPSAPAKPDGIAEIRAMSKTSVYIAWEAVDAAKTYTIEYTDELRYFESTGNTTSKTGIMSTSDEITGLETGKEYFFRICAVNDADKSPWSDIKSVVVGSEPVAPTTWSSTTTGVVDDYLKLYWVHNSEDGSSQTYADLELIFHKDKTSESTIDIEREDITDPDIDDAGQSVSILIKNTTDEDNKDKTSECTIDTGRGYINWVEDTGIKSYYLGSEIKSGAKFDWRVRTAGITKKFGEFSTRRTITVYAKPTLDFRVTDSADNSLKTITSFPFDIVGIPNSTDNQTPIGYHLDIVAKTAYETADNLGNPKTVNVDDIIYSRHFDIRTGLRVTLSAGDISLENGASYKAKCVVAMDSGLTAEAEFDFTVQWSGAKYLPNAEISIDQEALTASIRPYCEDNQRKYMAVALYNRKYVLTGTEIDAGVYGEPVKGAKLETGEIVYSGVTDEGEPVIYAIVNTRVPVTNVYLSVYRREFDGSFTEIARKLDGEKATTVTDPHPALDFARYRIVAEPKTTGSVSYYDLPGYPVGGTAAVIQWDEAWTTFETSEEAALAQQPWTGSLLKLPYNIDVSDKLQPDVELIEYIGRSHPVTYYGTQLGQTSSWNATIPKSDKDTIYALRRLARWMGDVYVREPSGTGYWANITVSFPQKHGSTTIPVTLDITRVEGGM